ncbi:type II toxin-antitoxin system HipA family toxin [Taklimakanibacter lacteus]|uniref:type II toxin-antitoxin system HipA family toxin n=1 Tax=Taklimakanibacter lacteus TaxID=2268456 RepID=UPI000E6685DC
MPDVSVLNVLLHGDAIGTITNVPGDQSIFAFSQGYIDNPRRPTLSLRFKDSLGGLITDIPKTQTRVTPFFANMLPEGSMRDYLALRAGVSSRREFFLLWALGADLPGAMILAPADGAELPPDEMDDDDDDERKKRIFRFSLAGVQLKFSAVKEAAGGLTIPVQGMGGSWIVKLPSTKFAGVPENEFSMMSLAAKIGMDVPDIKLVSLKDISGLPDGIGELKGSAYAIRRFDRADDGSRIHIEDFAQVFDVFPEDKYKRASMRNIADVIAAEAGQDDIAELIRRMVFNTLIGNADMHLKNWSLIYSDRRTARLSPAYDFVSTIPYIDSAKSALTIGRSKQMKDFSIEQLKYLAGKARLPEKLVTDTARKTVALFHEIWAKEKKNLALSSKVVDAIDAHIKTVPVAAE